MSTSEVSRQRQQQQQHQRTRASSYFSARERPLKHREHESSEARELAAYQPRAPPHQENQVRLQLEQQQHQRQTTSSKMEQQQRQEQSSESGQRQPVGQGRSFRSLIAATNSDRIKLSVSPASSGAEPLDERPSSRTLNDHSELEHSQSEDEQTGLEHSTGEQLDQNKQHVGPVMGIFFKVWSLVKVTRMRHNKMRRQNSDDASQFHFISGDQLASTSSAQSSATLAHPATGHLSGSPSGKHILQDSHFRRAGSQPLPASHISQSASQHEFGAHQQPYARLQVQPLAGAGHQHQPQGASTINSSSSGVSSATSSSLVANEHEQLASCQRPTGDRSVATKRADQTPGEQPTTQKARPSQKSAGKSWTSRIKSRASAGSQQSSLNIQQQQLREREQQLAMSRYHFRRADANLRQVGQGQRGQAGSRPAGIMGSVRPVRQLRSHSELQQLDELKKRPLSGIAAPPASSLLMSRIRQRQAQRKRSDDLDGEEDEDENTRTNEDEMGAGSDDDDEDSDLNDIYSTPNDSIQSVPSTQLLLTDQRRASSTALSQPLHPIVKSFSSQNFNQILQQQQLVDAMNHATIDERAEQKSSSSSSASSKTTTNNNSNHQIDSIASETGGAGKWLLPATGQLQNGRQNGSRFFISSSSSEDSQTHSSVHAQPSQLINGKPDGPTAASAVAAANGHQVKIPIHFGLHRHEDHASVGATARPNSLILGPPTASQPHLATPSAVLLSGAGPLVNESAIAAMSPMFAPTQLLTQKQQQQPVQLLPLTSQLNGQCPGYKKSPSLFEMSNQQRAPVSFNTKTRFSSRYPTQSVSQQPGDMYSFLGRQQASDRPPPARLYRKFQVPHSVSLHDCKLNETSHDHTSTGLHSDANGSRNLTDRQLKERSSEYKLAQMLLKLGSNPSAAKDQDGCTALMHSVMGENLSAFKCLLEHGVDLNEANHEGLTALDLICSKPANEIQMEMFNMLIDHHVDFDRTRPGDGSRLLDRLISLHVSRSLEQDKLPYIDCLLHNGAKLSSSTWLAANGKHELQLRLLRKLCQDGYFLYKKCSIEAAVYRFEYALKRIEELEQQLSNDCCRSTFSRRRQSGNRNNYSTNVDPETTRATQQVKYQTYLGLSRCERKRKFFRRALEFAHMSILVDATSYEGYYSKAHILKDLGEIDDSLIAIDQTDRLVNKSVEHIKAELSELQNQEESIVFDGCFQVHDPNRACWIESKRAELIDNLEYLEEAKKHISRLRSEILEEKLHSCDTNSVDNQASPKRSNHPVST